MAATGAEIASAYVTITTKMPGIQKDIAKQLGGVDGQRIGSGLGAKMSAGLKTSLKVGGAAAAAVLGTALVKGFGRLKAIETAEAKMRGIGFTSKQIAGAMDNALKSVQGTAFGLGDAASTASQLMAAGIKPGKELEGLLSSVANNAALAGSGFGEMGSIFAKAATQANGVQNDVIGQLADRNIPIYQELGKVLGVTDGEVFKLASQGKINFEQFAQAAEAAAGTAAKEMGGTTTGAFDNMMAALGRLGAKILKDIFPLIGPLFQNITKWLDEAMVHVEPVVDAFGTGFKNAIEGVKTGWEWLKNNSDWLGPLAVGIAAGAAALKAYLFWNNVFIPGVKAAKAGMIAFNAALRANPIGIIVTAVAALVAGLVWFFTQTKTGKKIWGEFTGFLSEAWANVSSFFKTVWESYLKPVFDGIGVVVQWLWKNILEPYFNAWKFLFAVVGGIIAGVWESVLKPVFDGIGAVIGWLWNNIVKPYFGLVAAQFRAVGAVVSWLWTNAVQPAFAFIGQAISLTWNSVIKPVFAAIYGVIANTLGPVFTWLKSNIIDPVWNGIKATISAVWTNGIKPVIDTLVRVIQSDPKKAFEAARDAIGVAWSGIQELAKKPVKFVIETVINGLIGTVNKILPDGMKIPTVPLPKGFSDGGYTGNLAPSAVAGVVHGNEHVIRAQSRAKIEARHPGLLDHMNRTGSVPGYKKGGFVHPLPGAVITEEYGGYPGHKGIDMALPAGSPIRAAASGLVNFSGWYGGGGWMAGIDHRNGFVTHYKHMMSPPPVKVGQPVTQGQVIGFEGSTGDSTGPHLHFETILNGNRLNPRNFMNFDGSDSGDGGFFNILGGLKDGLLGKLKDAFPGGGMFVDVAAGLASSAIDGSLDFVKSMLGFHNEHEPKLYDNGGWLQPGLSLVANKTGAPERILTDSQWDALADRGSGSGVFHLYDSDGVLFGTMRGIADDAVDDSLADQARARRFAGV